MLIVIVIIILMIIKIYIIYGLIVYLLFLFQDSRIRLHEELYVINFDAVKWSVETSVDISRSIMYFHDA